MCIFVMLCGVSMEWGNTHIGYKHYENKKWQAASQV